VPGSALERSGRCDEAFEAYRWSNRSIAAPFSPQAPARRLGLLNPAGVQVLDGLGQRRLVHELEQ